MAALLANPVFLLGLVKLIRLGTDAMGMSGITTLDEAQAELEKSAKVWTKGVDDWNAAGDTD